jgi:hypothetical protein
LPLASTCTTLGGSIQPCRRSTRPAARVGPSCAMRVVERDAHELRRPSRRAGRWHALEAIDAARHRAQVERVARERHGLDHHVALGHHHAALARSPARLHAARGGAAPGA